MTPTARLLTWLRVPAPFFVAIWTVAAWLVLHQSAAQFLTLFVTVPASFLQRAMLGLMLWLRPSVRIRRKYHPLDGVWYFSTLGTWMLGALLPAPWGGLVQIAAFVLGVIAMARIARVTQEENLATMQARADRLREHLAEQAAGPAWGPDAGKVITIETGETWREGADDPVRGGPAIEADIVDERERRDDEPGEEWTARPHGEQ